MKCKLCEKSSVYGAGEQSRCFEHLRADLKSPITYKEYHKPKRDKKEK